MPVVFVVGNEVVRVLSGSDGVFKVGGKLVSGDGLGMDWMWS